jgi:putative peptidoglycan lipid II flippase
LQELERQAASADASVSETVVQNAGIASFAVLMSRVSGLLREGIMSRVFGAGFAVDAFLIGFRIPNLTRDLFAEGALSSAFVPTFVESLKKQGREEAAELANQVATAILVFVGLFCVLGIFISPWLVGILTQDWVRNDPAKYELAVLLTQIMFPFLLLVALAAQAMGVLNSLNQYAVPALSSTFFNLGSVVTGLGLAFYVCPQFGLQPIVGMGFGVVFGGLLQLGVQVPSLVRSGFRFRPHLNFSHPGLRRIFLLMGPAILGNSAVQINVLVNTYFAASIVDPLRGVNGPVSWLGYAFRFMQLPIGLFGVAIATATLPAISKSAASKDVDEFRETLARSVGLVFLLTVPSSAGLLILGQSIVGAIYEGVRFQAYDTHQTATALACYSFGLAGYAAVKVLTPAFYTLNDSRTPMYVSVGSIAVNIAVAMTLVRGAQLGVAGLALSTSAVALSSFLILFATMRHRLQGIHGRRLRSTTLKVIAATAAMSAAIWLSSHGIYALFGLRTATRWIDLAISIPLGLAVLYGSARALKIEELDLATRALAGPLLRRLRK